MKTLIALLAVAACGFAAEAPYTPAGPKSQGALLLLPLQGNQTNASDSTTTTQSSVENATENLEEVNSKLMERLRQEQGAEQGVYHVYLQDGRLQRVQYTAAPIKPVQEAQKQQDASDNQQQQAPEILSTEFAQKRGVYFVQVPQERIQALQANRQQASQKYSQNSEAASAKYNEQPASQPIVRYLPILLDEDSSQYRQQQGEPTGYLASVQYSEVEPIQGPVYSYKPEGLTRILRYAPSL